MVPIMILPENMGFGTFLIWILLVPIECKRHLIHLVLVLSVSRVTQRKQLDFIGTYNRFADKQGIYNFPVLDFNGTY